MCGCDRKVFVNVMMFIRAAEARKRLKTASSTSARIKVWRVERLVSGESEGIKVRGSMKG